jgi:hypothetical protein
MENKNYLLLILITFTIGALGGYLLTPKVNVENYEDQITSLETQLNQSLVQINEISNQLTEVEENYDVLEISKEQLEQENIELKNTVTLLEEEHNSLLSNFTSLHSSSTEMETLLMAIDPSIRNRTRENEINNIINNAGKLPEVTEKDETTPQEPEYNDDKSIKYIVEKRDRTETMFNIMNLGHNDVICWPGALIKGEQLSDFIYEPILLDRNPINLTISLGTSEVKGPITHRVENPQYSTVQQGISDLVNNAITEKTFAPAIADLTVEEIKSTEDISFYLKASGEGGPVKLDANFNWDQSNTKTKIIGAYHQIYYTISVDPPQMPASFFSETCSINDVQEKFASGVTPVYVSSVGYGMMVVIFAETEVEESKIEAALNAAYNGNFNAEVDTGLTAKKCLEQSSLKIRVYGGSTQALGTLYQGFEGFKTVIDLSKNLSFESPGIPLQYTFRYLTDNTIAQISKTSQYTTRKPIQIKQRIRVTAVEFLLQQENDRLWDLNNEHALEMCYIGLQIFAYNQDGTKFIDGDWVYQKTWPSGAYGVLTTASGGNNHHVPQQYNTYTKLVIDSENQDFDKVRIQLRPRFKEDDDPAGDDGGDDLWWGEWITIYGKDFFDNNGVHYIDTNGVHDGKFRVKIKLEPIPY